MSEFDGILLIDKPAGLTSFDVVARLRGMTRTKRIGHAGTLDPMATGVLPVFFGRAAKAVELLPNHDKTYLATIKLGIVTDTQDITGQVLSQSDCLAPRAQLEAGLSGITGPQRQIPPMYSAVRVNGKRLYNLARRGVEIPREPREIEVYSAELVSAREDEGVYTIRVKCSRGTYIRTLFHDLGASLGCGAAVTELRREEACGFPLEGCISLEDAQRLSDAGALLEMLLPVASAFSHLPALTLTDKQAAYFCGGLQLGLSQLHMESTSGDFAVFAQNGRFLGLARPDIQAGVLSIIKLFVLRDSL